MREDERRLRDLGEALGGERGRIEDEAADRGHDSGAALAREEGAEIVRRTLALGGLSLRRRHDDARRQARSEQLIQVGDGAEVAARGAQLRAKRRR